MIIKLIFSHFVKISNLILIYNTYFIIFYQGKLIWFSKKQFSLKLDDVFSLCLKKYFVINQFEIIEFIFEKVSGLFVL